MSDSNQIWSEIDELLKEFEALHLHENVDYDKFFLYSLIAHSTAIEGSTLTELDVQLLFDENLTTKNKPLTDFLMNLDLKQAYDFAIEQAALKTKISSGFLVQLNERIMKSTGSVYHVAGGTFHSDKGEFRLCGVTAGFGGKSYMNYLKVPAKTEELCRMLSEKIDDQMSIREIYNLSFDAHFNLVTIHPWVDGNGRTARLLMNYIQYYKNVFPVKIFQDNKKEYIQSLIDSREQENLEPFRNFMASQFIRFLTEEIRQYKNPKNGNDFDLMF